jgi:hypothetical protein
MVGAAEDVVRLSQSILNQFDMNIGVKRAQLSAFFDDEKSDQVNLARFAIDEMQINRAMFVDMKHICEALIETDCFGLYISKTTPVYTWYDIACELAFDLQVAMRPNNPTLQMGLSNAGPMQRFVAAAVPHTTGERPKVELVGKYLKDHPPRLLLRESQGNPADRLSPGNIRS